jgi:alpha-glucosidase
MGLGDFIRGMSSIGAANLVRSVFYALRRRRLDDQHQPQWWPGDRETTVGRLRQVDVGRSGAMFRFEAATLECRFLAPDLVRLTWEPGALPQPWAIAKKRWEGVPVTATGGGSGWSLNTCELHLLVTNDGCVRLANRFGRFLRRELPPARLRGRWVHRAELMERERIFGLGERTAPLNLRGGKFRMWNRDPRGGYGPGQDPLYVSAPVYLGMHAEGSYLVFYENPSEADFSFADKAEASFATGALRYYLIPGPPQRALERLSELTGRPSLPPLWALGYHQSRWSYRDEREVRDLVAGFREHGLPLGVVHLDIHYMDGYRVFTVNQSRFPDLRKLTDDLAAERIRTVTIVDPGVKTDRKWALYRQGIEGKVFCSLPGGKGLFKGPVWPGRCVFPDFTDPRARDWWAAQYGRVVEWGVAGVWHDMNEPAVFALWGDPSFPRCTVHSLEGRGGDHVEAHNVYALLEAEAGRAGLKRARPGARPWILSRSGWVGSQRSCWHWTGDCNADWWTLAQSVRIAIGMSLSGLPYVGPDIGGFAGHPEAELYTRWFQAATFLPFFRTHCSAFVPRREPWLFGEPTLAIVREFLKLRYRLLPYWYTLAWEASKTGRPLVRPMFWEAPGNEDLWGIDDQFMLGDALLVAPVMAAGVKDREVVLPSGRWYDFWTGTPYDGPARIRMEAPLNRIPLLVKGGTVLPLSARPALPPVPGPLPPMGDRPRPVVGGRPQAPEDPEAPPGIGSQGCVRETSAFRTPPTAAEERQGDQALVSPWPDVILHLYLPGSQDPSGATENVLATGHLYTDAGDGYGPWRSDRFEAQALDDGLELVRRETDEGFPAPSCEVHLHGLLPAAVQVDGTAVTSEGGRIAAGRFQRILILR